MFVLVMLATGVFSETFGQISDTPTNKNISLDSKTLYQHGYNKDNLSAPTTYENIDTVMVSSVMNYFVMPDKNYNTAYYAGGSYAATNLTASQFSWTIGNGSSFAHQTVNGTNTSPWIKVTWAAPLGATTITVKENPLGLPANCESQSTTINAYIISKPTIAFTAIGGSYTYSECYEDAAVATGVLYNFGLTIATQSSQLEVDYTVTFNGVAQPLLAGTNVPIVDGKLPVTFNQYGAWAVTITKVTDRIARKCDVVGDITSAANVFTHNVMPYPQTGPAFHIPNEF